MCIEPEREIWSQKLAAIHPEAAAEAVEGALLSSLPSTSGAFADKHPRLWGRREHGLVVHLAAGAGESLPSTHQPEFRFVLQWMVIPQVAWAEHR